MPPWLNLGKLNLIPLPCTCMSMVVITNSQIPKKVRSTFKKRNHYLVIDMIKFWALTLRIECLLGFWIYKGHFWQLKGLQQNSVNFGGEILLKRWTSLNITMVNWQCCDECKHFSKIHQIVHHTLSQLLYCKNYHRRRG